MQRINGGLQFRRHFVGDLTQDGAGSSCGKNLSTELTSTIGDQRRTNPSVQPMREKDFVELIMNGQPAAPAYFSVDAAMNKRVHPLLDQGRKDSRADPGAAPQGARRRRPNLVTAVT